MKEALDDYEEERKKRASGNQYKFNNFIFDTLLTDGAPPGTIGVIASQSGSGKSTLLLHLIRSLIRTDVPCMYFSLEMSNTTTIDRLLSAENGIIPYAEFVRPPDRASYDMITKTVAEMRVELDQKTMFRICDSPSLSIKEIEKHVEKFLKDIDKSYAVIGIDLLSMVKEFTIARPRQNYADSITISMDEMNAVAKNLGVHFVGVVQMNRDSMADMKSVKCWDDLKKLRPLGRHVKSAGAYEERCRYLLGAFRPRHWAKQIFVNDPQEWQSRDDIIEVMTLKQNSGDVDLVEGIFDYEHFDIIPITNTTKISGP